MEEDGIPAVKRRGWVVALLVLLPLWLVVSSGVGIWLYMRHEERKAKEEQLRYASPVTAVQLGDFMGKLRDSIGERHVQSEAGRAGLRSMAAMVEGLLGRQNAGYGIERIPGPDEGHGSWPILVATLEGKSKKLPALWLVAGFDGHPGKVSYLANGTAAVSLVTVARAMVERPMERTVHFAFVPHLYDEKAPVAETLKRLKDRIGSGAGEVVRVEAWGEAADIRVEGREGADEDPGGSEGPRWTAVEEAWSGAGFPDVRIRGEENADENQADKAPEIAAQMRLTVQLLKWLSQWESRGRR